MVKLAKQRSQHKGGAWSSRVASQGSVMDPKAQGGHRRFAAGEKMLDFGGLPEYLPGPQDLRHHRLALALLDALAQRDIERVRHLPPARSDSDDSMGGLR